MNVWVITEHDGDGAICVRGVFANKPSFDEFLVSVGIVKNYLDKKELQQLEKEFNNNYVSSYSEIYIDECEVKNNVSNTN